MIQIHADTAQLSAAIQAVAGMDGPFKTARQSAMKSTGWLVRQALADYIYKDLGPKRHWMTARYLAQGKDIRWPLRRNRSDRPLAWLGNMARYRAAKDGSSVQIDFGKSRAGEPGTFDAGLQRIVRLVESGKTTPVTPAMRAHLAAATRRKRPKYGTVGTDYMALKKTTTTLKTPPRKIMTPAYNRVKSKIMPHFEQRFWKKFNALVTQ